MSADAGLRERALELRQRNGWGAPLIARELGISPNTYWLGKLVRDNRLPGRHEPVVEQPSVVEPQVPTVQAAPVRAAYTSPVPVGIPAGNEQVEPIITGVTAREPAGNEHNVRAAPAETETPPILDGITAEDLELDPDVLYRRALETQRHREALAAKRRLQSITFNAEPVALALVSDLHFGASGTDYEAARRDAELIASTPGMWAGFHGDGLDNFVIPALAHANRGPVDVRGQWRLFEAWLGWLGGKFLFTCGGNHDAWTDRMAGFDHLRNLVPKQTLYDPNQVYLTMRVGPASFRGLIRHKTRFNSVYNALHGIKQQWRLGEHDFDFGVAGHVHRGAVYEPFYGHGKRRWAVLTGAYKVEDSHALAEGYLGGGKGTAAAIVFTPEGVAQPFDDLEVAADFLQFLRLKARLK